MGFTVNKKQQLGLSILEAIVSTAIVGIGFVAVFQMVNYAVQSIDVSGERTKANYIVSMIAEDMIGNKDTLFDVDPRSENIVWNLGVASNRNDDTEIYRKFSEHLMENPWEISQFMVMKLLMLLQIKEINGIVSLVATGYLNVEVAEILKESKYSECVDGQIVNLQVLMFLMMQCLLLEFK